MIFPKKVTNVKSDMKYPFIVEKVAEFCAFDRLPFCEVCKEWKQIFEKKHRSMTTKYPCKVATDFYFEYLLNAGLLTHARFFWFNREISIYIFQKFYKKDIYLVRFLDNISATVEQKNQLCKDVLKFYENTENAEYCLAQIPKKLISIETCWYFLRKDVKFFKYIPHKTKRMNYYAVGINGHNISFVEHPEIRLILKAIKRSGLSVLAHVYPTDALCKVLDKKYRHADWTYYITADNFWASNFKTTPIGKLFSKYTKTKKKYNCAKSVVPTWTWAAEFCTCDFCFPEYREL